MSGQIIGPIGVLPTAGAGLLTFTATDVTQAWQIGSNSPYTFSANIGTASSDRIVVVCTYLDATASDVTAMTINGVSATAITSYALATGMSQAMYAALVTSGSGAQNIVITTVNAFPAAIEIMVGTITGSATATVSSIANVPAAVTNDPHAISISSVPANGIAIIATEIDAVITSGTCVWTGTSSSSSDGFIISGGANLYRAAIAHGTGNSVSWSGGSSGRTVGLLMASWGP